VNLGLEDLDSESRSEKEESKDEANVARGLVATVIRAILGHGTTVWNMERAVPSF